MGDNDVVLLRTVVDEATQALNEKITPQLLTYLRSRFYNAIDLYKDKAYKENLLYACIQYIPSMFFGFSHGTEVSLLAQDGTPALDLGTTVWMNNKIVYLYACKCGKELAQALVDSGAKAVLAYDDLLYIVIYEDGRIADGFPQTCLLPAQMLAEGYSVKQAYEKTKEEYDKWISVLEEQGDTLAADLLRWNRDHFVLKGTGESKLSLSYYLFMGMTDVFTMANILIWGIGQIALEGYRAYKIWKGER